MKDLNLIELFSDMIQSFLAFAPRLIGAIAVLLIGWIVAKFIRKLVKTVLLKIGINRLSDYINNMDLFGENKFKISLSHIISAFVYYFIMLMIWVSAADVLGVPAITNLFQNVINYLPNLMVAFVYLLLGVFLADIARKFILTTLTSLGIPSSRLIAGFVFYFLIINILLGALTQAKVNTAFIASNISIILGGIVLAFAIGYGLASKDAAGNLISSFYWKDKFDIGDEITVEEVNGRIVSVEKSHLILENDDSDRIIIPMNKVAKNTVTIRRKGGE